MNDEIRLVQDVRTNAPGAAEDGLDRLALWLADVSAEDALAAVSGPEWRSDGEIEEPTLE